MLSLKALGERIASARRALKLTQTTVAESAGVSRPTLASLENGRAGELGFSKIARILSVLGLELRLSTANLQRPTLDELLADNSDEDNTENRLTHQKSREADIAIGGFTEDLVESLKELREWTLRFFLRLE